MRCRCEGRRRALARAAKAKTLAEVQRNVGYVAKSVAADLRWFLLPEKRGQ